MSKQWNFLLVHNWQMLSSCNFQLPFNEIHSSNQLCNRMFYLKSSIHLHEIKFICCCVKDEFYSTCVVISNSLCSHYGSLSNFISKFLTNVRRCFFNNFLMSSLNRAISFIQMNIVSMLITKYLNFDMSWFLNVFFNKHMIITKTFQSFSFSCIQLIKELTFFHNDSHSFSSTTK